MKQIRVYVGCSLTTAPQEFRQSIDTLKSRLREQDFEVLEFIGLTGGTAAEVYRWDIHECVQKCDVMLAICDYPSIGLGWEMARATTLGTPVLAVAHTSATVTRLVLGAADAEPTFHFRRYEDFLKDVPVYLRELLSEEHRAGLK